MLGFLKEARRRTKFDIYCARFSLNFDHSQFVVFSVASTLKAKALYLLFEIFIYYLNGAKFHLYLLSEWHTFHMPFHLKFLSLPSRMRGASKVLCRKISETVSRHQELWILSMPSRQPVCVVCVVYGLLHWLGEN